MTFDLERARGLRDFLQDDCAEVGDVWGEMIAEIERLRADLEQSERVIEARLDVIDQQAARIQELGGMLSIRTEELEIAHSCARSEREMHEKELVVFARKIAELEDALVEGLTNFLHYRASCYDPARRCPYAKECDDCSTWDACGHVEKFRSEARRQLQAEGKIGPDANESHLRPYEVVAADLAGRLAEDRRKSWQITEERKAAIWHAVAVLKENDPDDEHLWDEEIAVLRAMLREAE